MVQVSRLGNPAINEARPGLTGRTSLMRRRYHKTMRSLPALFRMQKSAEGFPPRLYPSIDSSTRQRLNSGLRVFLVKTSPSNVVAAEHLRFEIYSSSAS